MANDTKDIMTNIKTFKELRKLFKDTDWFSFKFSEKEIINSFNERQNYNGRSWTSSLFHRLDNTKDEYCFNKNKLDQRIDKKTQSDVYRFRFLKITNKYGNDEYNRFEAVENSKSFSVYEVAGTNNQYTSKHIPTDTKFWVDDYTDQLLYVRYKREDVWFNNFFRNSIDSSIPNNYDEIHTEKTFHFAYQTATYKIVTAKGFDYSDAKKKLEKDNPELEWKYGRQNNKWEHLFEVKVDKLPEGNFDINDLATGASRYN